MASLDRYCYTDVYDDGTVVCPDRKLPRKPIPKEELCKKKLLIQYHYAGPDHPYAKSYEGWLVLNFERNISISQLQKIVDSPDIDSDAIEHIKKCIAKGKIEDC